MAPGLFTWCCPDCGGELASDSESTTSMCTPCGRSYLTRFGHLIPIDVQQPQPEPAVVPARRG